MKKFKLLPLMFFCFPFFVFASGLVYGEIRAIWALGVYIGILEVWVLIHKSSRFFVFLSFSFLVVCFGPIIFIALGILGSEVNRAYWDSRVKAMCILDGGAEVYRVVHLSKHDIPPSRLSRAGNVELPAERHMIDEDKYYYMYEREVIKDGKPKISRSEHKVIQRDEKELLGVNVSFSRVGQPSLSVLGILPPIHVLMM